MKQVFFVLLILILFIFLTADPLLSYFSQDDFFHLSLVYKASFRDLLNFFNPMVKVDYSFYRPLSREFFNFLMFKTFGLNSLAFHLVNFFLIILTGFLAFKFIQTYWESKKLLIIFLSLYFLSAVHNVELYYLSSVQTLLSTTFMLLSLIFFRYFQTLKFNNRKNYWLSWGFYSLALLSHESAIILIGIIFLMQVVSPGKLNKESLRKVIYIIAPFFLILLIRGAIFFLTPHGISHEQEVYRPVLSLKSILNSLSWYILWSFGITEILVDFLGHNLKLNPNFLRWYKDYALTVFPSFLILLFLSGYGIFRNFRRIFEPKLYLVILSFFLSLAPFIFFPEHKFVYYLTFPQIWFCLFLSLVLVSFEGKEKILWPIFLVFFTLISIQTNRLNIRTLWAAKRAVAAKSLLMDIKNHYPKLPSYSTLYLIDDLNYPQISKEWGSSSKQASFILSGSDAVDLVYDDLTIKVKYQALVDQKHESLPKDPKTVVAKFPY